MRFLDGDINEEDIRPIERYCRPNREHRRHPRDGDDENSERRHPRGREILRGVTH
jgi:hypothetical protein